MGAGRGPLDALVEGECLGNSRVLSTIARACGGRGFVYFFRKTIHVAASARWSGSAVGMLGVVLPGGHGGVVEEGGNSAFGWETNEKGGGWLVLPQG